MHWVYFADTWRCDFLQIDRAGLHAPLLRPEFVSLPYFSADTLTGRNNSSSTIFRELEKELRSAFHISDRVCNAVERPEGTAVAREEGREKREEGKPRITRNHLRLAIFVRRARSKSDRTGFAFRSSIRLIFYLGRGDLRLAYAFRARGSSPRAAHVARMHPRA